MRKCSVVSVRDVRCPETTAPLNSLESFLFAGRLSNFWAYGIQWRVSSYPDRTDSILLAFKSCPTPDVTLACVFFGKRLLSMSGAECSGYIVGTKRSFTSTIVSARLTTANGKISNRFGLQECTLTLVVAIRNQRAVCPSFHCFG